MNQRFGGKIALIIGGGRGMGRAVAEALAAEGASVVIAARTPKHGEDTVASLRAAGHDASLVLGDISERASVKTMIDGAAALHGRLDIVVQTAADSVLGQIKDLPDDSFDYLIRSNVQSVFWVAKDAAPYLSKAQDKGRLIFISSATANRTYVSGLTAYASTKAFLNSFARGLALELAPLNILVNVIEPGLTASDRLQARMTPEQIDVMTANFPIPRACQPSEIASAVLFMASPEASYVTGASLLIDGGCSLVPLNGMSAAIKPTH
ncbi:MAG: SDR family oxidoreductase [Pseudomonadota bacterium]|nr:SDR family oxidoreductase [Pseudomonadota bacterium]